MNCRLAPRGIVSAEISATPQKGKLLLMKHTLDTTTSQLWRHGAITDLCRSDWSYGREDVAPTVRGEL